MIYEPIDIKYHTFARGYEESLRAFATQWVGKHENDWISEGLGRKILQEAGLTERELGYDKAVLGGTLLAKQGFKQEEVHTALTALYKLALADGYTQYSVKQLLPYFLLMLSSFVMHNQAQEFYEFLKEKAHNKNQEYVAVCYWVTCFHLYRLLINSCTNLEAEAPVETRYLSLAVYHSENDTQLGSIKGEIIYDGLKTDILMFLDPRDSHNLVEIEKGLNRLGIMSSEIEFSSYSRSLLKRFNSIIHNK